MYINSRGSRQGASGGPANSRKQYETVRDSMRQDSAVTISKVLSKLRLFLVSYIVSYLGLGLVLGIELMLDLGLGSLSILFIVEYQFF